MTDELMLMAWDDYIQDGGDRAVHPMFADAWRAACEACAQLCDEESSCEGIAERCAAKIRAMVNEQS